MNPFDLFADALWQYFVAGYANLRTERDDGYVGREDVSWYYATYRDFPTYEKRALKFACGKVLDVGCGAGRHSLYLQKQGLHVTAVDISPDIVLLAQAAGVKDARVANVCEGFSFRDGQFDTVLLFGNNLGICGTPQKFQKMLRELYRVTSPRGRIIATTRLPSTINPIHRGYLRRNLERRRAIGQVRVRLMLNGERGAWFDLLLLAPTDLMEIAAKAGWELSFVATEDFEQGYSVVLIKSKRSAKRVG